MRLVLSFLIMFIGCCQVYSQTSLKFDGIDDYVYVPTYASLNWEQDFTLETELLSTDFSHSSTLTIAEYYHQDKQEGWHWYLTKESLAITIGKETYQVPYTSSEKAQLVITRQGEHLYFYANKKLLGKQFIDKNLTVACEDCELFLGNQASFAAPFKGELFRIRVWNQSIDLEELNLPTKALVGSWSFEEGEGQFVNNHASPLHYGRLGKTFYADGQDAVWQSMNTLTSNKFVIQNKHPKEGEAIQLLLLETPKTSFYWLVNREQYTPEQLSQATFASGMNVIQLVEEGEEGNKVSSKMVTIDAALKTCLTDELLLWRNSPQGRKATPKSRIVSTSSSESSSGELESTTVSNPNTGGPYVIPVIFHIIGNTQAELSSFTNARIQAQLAELNTQFANNNTNISFCLAQRLPIELTSTTPARTWQSFGTATTPGQPGITYTLNNGSLNIDNFDLTDDDLIDTRLPGVLPFDPEEYLSIYVTPYVTVNNNISSTQGVANVGSSGEAVDGIGIGHGAFIGSGGSPSPLGRVLVHEVGHWLSLYHVFQGGTGNDLVCDTYDQALSTSDYNNSVNAVNGCTDPYGTRAITPTCAGFSPYNQGENHMDYWLESCLNLFTAGQIARMHNCLDSDRTFVHSQLNLINTGVQHSGATACAQGADFTGDFSIAALEACDGAGSFRVEGFNPPVGPFVTYNWQVGWSAANGTPAPAATIGFSGSGTSRLEDITITGTNGTAAGFWTIELTVTVIDANLNRTTLVSTIDVEVLDCSSDYANYTRYRTTTDFSPTDWELEGISVATGSVGTVNGYLVAGTDVSGSETQGVLLGINEAGEILWRRSADIAGSNVHFYDITSNIAYNGNTDCYAITGSVEVNGREEVLAMIVDKNGITLYEQSFAIADNSGTYPYAGGKQIVQLSSAFNNQLAIVGVAGDGINKADDKVGFIVGFLPSSSTIAWSHFYNTIPYISGTDDHDFVESVVEVSGLINGTQQDGLMVIGNGNRDNYNTSSIFISCLLVSGGVVTEAWKDYHEVGSNVGAYEALGVAEDGGRVFVMGYSDIAHGTFLHEVSTNDGTLGGVFQIRGFTAQELVVHQNEVVLFGKNSDDKTNAFKIDLPNSITSPWPNSNTAITRSYDGTEISFSPHLMMDGRENFVIAPNQGYMGIDVVDVQQSPHPDIEMTLLKLDDNLINGCANSTNIRISSLPNPFSDNVTVDNTVYTISNSTVTTNTNPQGGFCMIDGCRNNRTFNLQEEKCTYSLPLVVSGHVPTGSQYRYQWSPTTDLDDPNIMEPTTTTTMDIQYTLTVVNTQTKCVEATGTYDIIVPTTLHYSRTYYYCNDPTIPNNGFTFDLSSVPNIQSGYTYQWTSSSAYAMTLLSSSSVLEPTCTAVTNQNYTLIATPIGSCGSVIVEYNVIVNNPIEQTVTDICIDVNHFSHYIDNNQNAPFRDRANINTLFENNFSVSTLPAGGIWQVEYNTSDPSTINIYSSSPRTIIDPTTGDLSVAVGMFNGLITAITYTYPDNSHTCGFSTYRVITALDDNIITADKEYICEGETVNFTGTPITINPSYISYIAWIITDNLSNTIAVLTNSNTTMSYTFTNLPSGTYKISRLIVYNCPGSSVDKSSVSIVQVHIVDDNPTITRDCNGLSIDIPTGNPSIVWYQVNNNGSDPIVGTGQNIQPTSVGDYYAIVTYHQGCSYTTNTYQYQGSVDATFTQQSPSCGGANDGEVTVQATGGYSPYTYQWDANANNQTTATATNLSAGTYQVTVMDVCGVSVIRTVTLQDPSPITSTWTAIDATCANAGSATIIPSGGTAPYTYQWDANANSQTTATASNLSAGSYGVTITDANGCTSTDLVQVAVGTPLQVQLTTNQANCNNISITNTIANGTAPYTYQWSTGATTPDLSGSQIASSGNYCVTVTDANGCTATACTTIDPVGDIDFSKSVSNSQAQAGDVVTYTISINNNCQIAATFDLTDVLPVGLWVDPNTLGNFTYNNTDRTLTQRVTLAGFSNQTYTYDATVVGDGACTNSLILNNQITAELVADPAVSFTDNALVEVTDGTGSQCQVSNLSVSFAQAEQAGVLLPMTGATNATNTPQNVVVNGTWRLAANQVYEFTSGSDITMESGAQIIVSDGARLTIAGTTIRGCTCLWHRILVESGGELIITSGSQIEDAQYAVETQDGAMLTIVESNFENNFIGWYMAPSTGAMSQQVTLNGFNNNYFASRGLKTAFLNAPTTPTLTEDDLLTQIALPSGGAGSRLVGLAGVYLWNGSNIAIMQATPSNNNTFEDLVTGIAGFNTNLSVNNASFRFIRENTVYYANNLGFQGAAIHVQGGEASLPSLDVVGTINSAGNTTFEQVDIGVSANRAELYVSLCWMNQVAEVGIRAIHCNASNISIKENRMDNVEKVGIECKNNFGNTQSILSANSIYMHNSMANVQQFRAGINVDNCEHVSADQNEIQSVYSQFGIYINNVTDAILHENHISMMGSAQGVVRSGIAIYGQSSFVTCNTVTGEPEVRQDPQSRAFFGNNLDNSTWRCNQMKSTYRGAYFEDNSSLIFKGNVFEDHYTGLFLSSNAVIGGQVEHGNIWIPSTMPIEAENQNTSNPLASQFIIHPNNPVPSNVIASSSQWFILGAGDNEYPFNCNTAGYNSGPLCGEPLPGFPEEQQVANDSRATDAPDDYSYQEQEELEDWNINLYPNPAFQYLTIESKQLLDKDCQVEVYNALGQKVTAKVQIQTTREILLNIEGLVPGVYTLHLLQQEKKTSKTFSVVRP